MKKLSILFSLIISLVFVSSATAQTPTVVTFAKGATEKTMTITVAAGITNKYSITVKKDQVINVGVEGDINVSKTTEFPVISVNAANAVEDVDQTQDGEGYLSILAGRNGKFIIDVANSDKKRARTFTIKFKVTDDKADFAGGEEVDQ